MLQKSQYYFLYIFLSIMLVLFSNFSFINLANHLFIPYIFLLFLFLFYILNDFMILKYTKILCQSHGELCLLFFLIPFYSIF